MVAMRRPVIHMVKQANNPDLCRRWTPLKGKRSTTKRSTVMMQMMNADTSFDSKDRKPAICKFKFHREKVLDKSNNMI